jgi:hypothetical protein
MGAEVSGAADTMAMLLIPILEASNLVFFSTCPLSARACASPCAVRVTEPRQNFCRKPAADGGVLRVEHQLHSSGTALC